MVQLIFLNILPKKKKDEDRIFKPLSCHSKAVGRKWIQEV